MLNKSFRNTAIMLALIFIFYMFGSYFASQSLSSGKESTAYSYERMEKDAAKNKISAVEVKQNEQVPTGTVVVTLKGGDKKTFHVTDVNTVLTLVKQNKITYTIDDVKSSDSSGLLSIVLPWIVIGIIMMLMFTMMSRAASGGGGGNKMMNFGKSRAKMQDPTAQNIRFNQVAGLEEEKEDLKEIVDFLKNPQKYIEVGARIPKGVLLVGPPGTGKTLLAKAVSGEAGVPFFSISGSDFVEMFVGVGASRVRDLFADAKKNAPCIVFIDEIDAVARQRGSGLGGGHDEREQTLNQLLVEMDGFGANEGIIVMAATNRVDILDPAILRPGRFDRKVAVGKPDVRGREEILKVHSKGKPLSEDVDLHQVARTTPGFSGADLENLMNEAAIRAAKNDARFIRMEDIQKSFIKVGIGTEKKSRLVPELEKKITAYHEAGHAILFHLLPDVGPVYTVSIIPTGMGAAGYTMPVPENDNVFETKGRMIQEMKVGMGGRIAEELIFDDVTTGASQDIKQVTETARSMVTKYGMSERLGFINYEENTDEVFLGRDLGHSRSFSEEVASVIDKEVKKLVDDCYIDAKRILVENMDVLHACANLLIEKERINREEFEALFKNDKTEEIQKENVGQNDK
ncbi:MAG: ATP-dependent zinc metalloprotease FtsH [Lachnospiraceae bacterium]|nr:ATP-dependent zinc metalloprotease FtsH [Lachnospiraceae bacterium]MDY5497566.1 ATP-dependent zinc metalloprotease FtsH [Anaerobutyricum sp.]